MTKKLSSPDHRWVRHIVRAEDCEQRLDRWLRNLYPGLSQSFLQALLRKRKIRLEHITESSSQATPANSFLTEGSIVAIDAQIHISQLQPLIGQKLILNDTPLTAHGKTRLQQLQQRIVYKDAQFLVLNKPHGLAVQDGSNVVESLAQYLPWIAKYLLSGLPGGQNLEPQQLRTVHRLDKETSGLLVLARSRLAATKFSELLRRGAVHKTYAALVASNSFKRLKQLEGRKINVPIRGKSAHTVVEQVWKERESPNRTWLQLRPYTGRKHQLRIHCAQVLRAPILGDTKYGTISADRMYLHAKRMRFPHPFASGQIIDVSCKI
ncbi:hypothetical protein CCR75_009638 [Bremia lactucae]|uniref:Pseudouridine synthase RsuA/RluA-like domain-containing protein n=1 Tax=Bremia lactucae TaxID=4779 RepID=A0A976FRE5_BRELC|nr:hypothetical protein CCR75_009638 [Bremia lactucae]